MPTCTHICRYKDMYGFMYAYKQNTLNVYHPVRKLDYFLTEREWEREA